MNFFKIIINRIFQKKFLKKIQNSYHKSINGEEKLWKVFWLWGFLIYVGSIPFALYTTLLILKLPQNLVTKLMMIILSALLILGGFIMFVKFPQILISSLIKCAKNGKYYNEVAKGRVVSFFEIIFPVIFLLLHSFYCLFIFIGICFYLFVIFVTAKELTNSNVINALLIGGGLYILWFYRNKLILWIKNLF